MRTDFDLQFLQNCANEDLCALCNILMYDNQGKLHLNESLSNSNSYISCYPDNMREMSQDLAFELQCYGGNSILNLIRHGYGPSYESIVYDVCKRMKVQGINKHDTTEEMEQKLLISVLSKAIGELSEERVRSIMEECGIRGYDFTKKGLIAALLALQIMNRNVFVVVINSVMKMLSRILVSRGIMMVGLGTFSRGLGLLFGPVGWLLFTGWAVWDLSGPAYRVTVPAVIQIAYMRVKHQAISNLNPVSV